MTLDPDGWRVGRSGRFRSLLRCLLTIALFDCPEFWQIIAIGVHERNSRNNVDPVDQRSRCAYRRFPRGFRLGFFCCPSNRRCLRSKSNPLSTVWSMQTTKRITAHPAASHVVVMLIRADIPATDLTISPYVAECSA